MTECKKLFPSANFTQCYGLNKHILAASFASHVLGKYGYVQRTEFSAENRRIENKIEI